MKKIVMLIIILLMLACEQQDFIDIENKTKYYCTSDSDCVAETCCHPNTAVNKDYRPNCSGLFCTTECMPRTLDCGEGNIKCISNNCSVILN